MEITVNYLAILVAAVASMVIGSVWYGPLFGKKFIALSGMDKLSPEEQAKMKKGMVMTYVWQFIASLVTFYVLAHIIQLSENFYNYTPLHTSLSTALYVWIGFIVPLKLSDALWGGKMSLFWLSIGNMLVTLLVAGAIIGVWR